MKTRGYGKSQSKTLMYFYHFDLSHNGGVVYSLKVPKDVKYTTFQEKEMENGNSEFKPCVSHNN